MVFSNFYIIHPHKLTYVDAKCKVRRRGLHCLQTSFHRGVGFGFDVGGVDWPKHVHHHEKGRKRKVRNRKGKRKKMEGLTRFSKTQAFKGFSYIRHCHS